MASGVPICSTIPARRTTILSAPAVVTLSFADPKTHKVVETITATREHPFMVQGVGFVIAGRLALGNAIVTRAGPALTVAKIDWKQGKQSVAVYNFEVDEDHTYFVGSANGGLWVHNLGPCSGIRQATLNPGVDGGVTAGRSLTTSEALDSIRRGEDVIANSRSLAKTLAKKASGNNRSIGPEIHGDPIDGFFSHFHPNPRNGSHIFHQ